MGPIRKDALPTWRLRRTLGCHFCGRPATQVQRIVAGVSAHICDACITECVSVLMNNGGFRAPPPERAHEPLPAR